MEIMKTSANFSGNYIKNFFGSRAFDDLDQIGGGADQLSPKPLMKMTSRTVSTNPPPVNSTAVAASCILLLTPPLLIDLKSL